MPSNRKMDGRAGSFRVKISGFQGMKTIEAEDKNLRRESGAENTFPPDGGIRAEIDGREE